MDGGEGDGQCGARKRDVGDGWRERRGRHVIDPLVVAQPVDVVVILVVSQDCNEPRRSTAA